MKQHTGSQRSVLAGWRWHTEAFRAETQSARKTLVKEGEKDLLGTINTCTQLLFEPKRESSSLIWWNYDTTKVEA